LKLRFHRPCCSETKAAGGFHNQLHAHREEAYALDQVGLDLYDQGATIEFGWRLRDTLKFDGLDPLLEQMAKDCQRARELTEE